MTLGADPLIKAGVNVLYNVLRVLKARRMAHNKTGNGIERFGINAVKIAVSVKISHADLTSLNPLSEL